MLARPPISTGHDAAVGGDEGLTATLRSLRVLAQRRVEDGVGERGRRPCPGVLRTPTRWCGASCACAARKHPEGRIPGPGRWQPRCGPARRPPRRRVRSPPARLRLPGHLRRSGRGGPPRRRWPRPRARCPWRGGSAPWRRATRPRPRPPRPGSRRGAAWRGRRRRAPARQRLADAAGDDLEGVVDGTRQRVQGECGGHVLEGHLQLSRVVGCDGDSPEQVGRLDPRLARLGQDLAEDLQGLRGVPVVHQLESPLRSGEEVLRVLVESSVTAFPGRVSGTRRSRPGDEVTGGVGSARPGCRRARPGPGGRGYGGFEVMRAPSHTALPQPR